MILKFVLTLSLIGTLLQPSSQSTDPVYIKEYYSDGSLKAEGWRANDMNQNYWIYYYPNQAVAKKGHFLNDKMNAYWYFYAEDGNLSKEGHFNEGKEVNWWVFYKGDISKKIQYSNGNKEGYALIYKNKQLKKAEKYTQNIKTGEWTSLIKFKLDNPEVHF